MYSTCLFCAGTLGRNESIEHFPVGRRLAFDAAKGRLWVICPTCARWNLSPLESRWEAIDEAERAYRDTKLRSATEHIGLARLQEGTELVRIGKPMLPEFAAWRYGGVFRKRYQRTMLLAAPPLVIGLGHLALFAIGAAPSLTAGVSTALLASTATQHLSMYRRARRVCLRVRDDDGMLWSLSAWDASRSELVNREDDAWTLRLAHRQANSDTGFAYRNLQGDSARRAIAQLLPTVNYQGDSAKTVSAAVEVASARGNLAKSLLTAEDREGRSYMKLPVLTLGRLPGAYRLALEMSLHEDDERRALDGELAALEARWREAEEIAGIADNLLLPSEIDAELERLRRVRQ
ncbi:hypothetical protein [Gemmatimonas groenlandica]|uniref:Uncharacterized protein n=1 Tax=Gemmatimonas groenlandica TaxID=2732249 RepID=A0A6M4IQH0_9BACT|nr:hypothetical protein [Gemmatimonas groenlandica]QJR36953.1 hypothetical protein HKW67_16225 [Gemmatimonas groenlandica]